MRLSKLQCIVLPVFLLLVYLSMSSYSGGISAQYTAGCTCHGGGVLNTNTLVSVAGPAGYQHNQIITYTVTVSNAAMAAAGFNLKCNIGQITSVGAGINTWSTTEISHSTPKTLSGGTTSWTFQWTAPATGSTALQFNIAGNAVNLNSSPDPGDQWNFGTIAPIPLPIEFSSFKLIVDRDIVKGMWQMASQSEVNYFEIERSSDGVNFDFIARMEKSKGVAYTFEDRNVVAGLMYYYRVKEVMRNGSEAYTQIESIMLKDKNNAILLYPNVFSGQQIYLRGVDFMEQQYTLRVASIEGKVLHQQVVTSNVIDLPATLSAGTYIASIVSGEGILYSGYIFKR